MNPGKLRSGGNETHRIQRATTFSNKLIDIDTKVTNQHNILPLNLLLLTHLPIGIMMLGSVNPYRRLR